MQSLRIELSEEQRQALTDGYKNGKTASYRKRCHILLLNHDGHSNKHIAEILGIQKPSVFNWIKRYNQQGIEGLQTKAGQGRPKILDEQHEQIIKECVNQERQRLRLITQEMQTKTGKQFSQKTLKRFLKKLATATNVSD